MGRVAVCTLVGLALIAAAVGFDLSRSPAVALGPPLPAPETLTVLQQPTTICQAGQTIPRGTTALRLWDFGFPGPHVAVEITQGGRTIARGEHASGWSGGAVTVPVPEIQKSVSGASVCTTVAPNKYDPVNVTGNQLKPAATIDSQPLKGQVAIEYLAPSNRSWFSRVTEVARRMGLGRAAAGTWIVLLVVLLMGALVLVCSLSLRREL